LLLERPRHDGEVVVAETFGELAQRFPNLWHVTFAGWLGGHPATWIASSG
jgi:hypothetical protein